MLIFFFTCDYAGGRPQPVSAPESGLATVEVMAFDSRGKFLGAPMVTVFESDDHTNFAAKFRNGVADRIPFGMYKVEGRLTGYSSEVRYIRIFEHRALVVLGLPVGRERPMLPPVTNGRILGSLPPEKKTFVKITGIFSSVSEEGSIGRDGEFRFAGLPNGLYLILVISEDGILASRVVSIPSSSIELEVAERSREK